MPDAELTFPQSPFRTLHSLMMVLVASLAPWSAAASQPEYTESADLYEIAVAAAVPVLPPPLRAFFEARIETLRQAAAPGAQAAAGSKFIGTDEDWHYVSLDVAARAGDVESRRDAARRFPRERDGAMALYASYGLREGGILPWIVQEKYEAAVRAFRGGEAEKIVAEAGVLLHFSVDAATPFKTTTHRGRRQRDHAELFKKFKNRLEYEVRVAPDRLVPVTSVIGATFDVLLEAHLKVDEIIVIDAAGIDAASLPAAGDSIAEIFAQRAAPILETQIESGAILAANLIAAAWLEAGKPDLKTAAASPSPAVSIPHTDSALYVGSQNSTVYHRSDCSHASRIKPENRVSFDSRGRAQAAGRTPCKACKPDASEKAAP